jgi:hypothetical protein
MRRLFLSAPATCALLLGSGMLLRAQAALRSESEDPRPAPMDLAPLPEQPKQKLVSQGTHEGPREQKFSQQGNSKDLRTRRTRARRRAQTRPVEGKK